MFLTFSCIGYAMPFILCTTICFCLPCIISILGYREDLTQPRGATPESINALPTHKFKLKKSRSSGSSSASEGGVVAAGTDKERAISGEDAVSLLTYNISHVRSSLLNSLRLFVCLQGLLHLLGEICE